MDISPEVMARLSDDWRILFQGGMRRAQPTWQKIGGTVGSVGAFNVYNWWDAFPRMRKWIGARQKNALSAQKYIVENEKFENTVAVPKTQIEDNQLAGFAPQFDGLGFSAMESRDVIIWAALADGFTNPCFDGQAFFAANHPNGDQAAYSNYYQLVLDGTNFNTVYTAMCTQVDSQGAELAIMPDLLVVGPTQRTTAFGIVQAEKLANLQDNPNKGIVSVHVEPRLGSSKKWFLMSTKGPVMPLLLQVRKEPQFI